MSTFLDVALEAVKQAEVTVMHYFDPKGVASENKADGSPVTKADTEAEAIIIQHIKAAFPDHAILAEESGREDTASEYRWIIDPIDGTKNYTRGLPFFGMLVALMKNGEVIMGVSNMPAFGEMMYAEKGQGAFLNGERVSVSEVKDMKDIYLTFGGLGYFEKAGTVDKITTIRDRIFQLRSFGDVYMYHMLAQGRLDVVVESSIKLHDVAPLKLIVEEAGGRATEIDGTELNMDTDNFLATNGLVHQMMIDYFA